MAEAKKLTSVLPEKGSDGSDPFAALNAGTKTPVKTTEEKVECLDSTVELPPGALKDFLKEPTTPTPPQRYKPDADADLVASLELFERLRDGSLLVFSAYDARDKVNERIEAIKARVELAKGEIGK